MFQNKDQIIEKVKLLQDTRILGLIAFGIIALLVTWSGVKAVQTNYELDKKIALSRQKNEIAKLENANLKLRNEYYNSPQYLELAARRQFGKAAPGEKLYLVPEEVALAKTTEMPKTTLEVVEEKENNKPKYVQNLEAWQKFLFR